jgi:ABC-type transport system involved in multi-copper enzyme maturation permease subunit
MATVRRPTTYVIRALFAGSFTQFVAILKDSLREALDSKVLYALLILSTLVVVGVASISFKPRPAEAGVSDIVARFPGAQGQAFTNQPPPLRYDVEQFRVLDEKKPWEGEYHFDLVVHEVEIKDAEGKEQPTEGVFRLLVFLTSLKKEAGQLTPEERESRKRLIALQEQAANLPPDRFRKFLDDKMREEVAQVSAAQMEAFITEQLSSRGSLQAKEVRFVSEQPREFRFSVQTAPRAETFRTWPHEITYGYGAYTSHGDTQIGPLLFGIEDSLIGGVGAAIAMLLATIVTAFFIPNMLRKGTVDLLLSKPIHRATLLAYKYIGGLTFMFLTTVVTVGGVWLVLGLRSGLWAPNFLLSIFILTFEFAIFYAVSTLLAVLTRSPIVCILVSCFSWLVLWAVGTGHLILDAFRELPKDLQPVPQWVFPTVDTIHFVLPRYKDLDALNSDLIGRDLLGPESPQRKAMDKVFSSISWGKSLGFTFGFIAIMLGLSAWFFSRKDY